jgi:rfaE bifunctional protein kinase chain/domain
MKARQIFEQTDGQHVIIIGDVMIDRYLTGSVNRISPEAPVPVVLHQSTDNRLGGAANVALNVQALGGIPLLCGFAGDDADGRLFTENLLPAHGLHSEGICISSNRRTTVKTRILGNAQQMLRIDSEDTHELNSEETELLLARVRSLLARYPVRTMILQDYNKGVLTGHIIAETIKMAKEKGVFVAVDPKKQHFLSYIGADLFKPNLKEIRESAPFPVSPTLASLEKAARFLEEKLQNRYTMLTLSEHGLFLKGDGAGALYSTIPRKIADVSGAGDTVISIAALCLSVGIDEANVARLSNMAGGQVCEIPGVVPVNRAVLEQEFNDRM